MAQTILSRVSRLKLSLLMHCSDNVYAHKKFTYQYITVLLYLVLHVCIKGYQVYLFAQGMCLPQRKLLNLFWFVAIFTRPGALVMSMSTSSSQSQMCQGHPPLFHSGLAQGRGIALSGDLSTHHWDGSLFMRKICSWTDQI